MEIDKGRVAAQRCKSAYGGGVRVALPLLLALSVLSACAKHAPESLVTKVMFTAAGSYDASADARTRQGKGLRQVIWQRQPPLPARRVVLNYDSDARPVSWAMTLEQPGFAAQALAGTSRTVNTPGGAGVLLNSGALKNVLALQQGQTMQLMTRGYAAQRQPELLPAFQP